MPNPTESFITRWKRSSASERANYALFLSEFCDLIEVPRPDPSTSYEEANTYVIDKAVVFKELDGSATTNFIDLYKRNCFVLEAKQGSNPQSTQNPTSLPGTRRLKRGTAVRGTHGWDEAMLAARGQAERYAKALPASEGWPPFLIVVDVGHSIELYADFSLTGKAYLPFPDPRTFRVLLDQLALPSIQERLRAIWVDPLSLDPARETAKVTREVAGKLATLARNLELQHSPKAVAEFLTRCIFTSFAEDVRLLPERGWLNLLQSLREDVANFPPMAEALWGTMNEGGFSPILRSHVLKFNGGLFESTKALPLNRDQLGLLIEAADSRWRDVEPAIFGTLLERALDPEERHALGAHYTPRAYVERLVIPTLVEPIRDDWRNALAVITQQVNAGNHPAAIETAQAFHRQLCSTRVLDPACGSGNFLYVALEHMKRLEGEVLETMQSLGETQQALEHTGLTVDPHQLLGIELNPRAAVIADLVLWIGYLQWHFRTRGDAQPPIPVIRNFRNIVNRDALLDWDSVERAFDDEGQPLDEWDGKTFRQHPVTGRRVPDESSRKAVWKYLNPTITCWPDAEYIIGNPPFLGKLYLLRDLGLGYVQALRQAYEGLVPAGVDFGMYWWYKASAAILNGSTRQAGLINTKSITQAMNRRVIRSFFATSPDARIVFAIPNHPWVDSSDGAAVRIAMSTFARSTAPGVLNMAVTETTGEEGVANVGLSSATGLISEDFRLGVDITKAEPLAANDRIAGTGFILGNRGFVLSRSELSTLLGGDETDHPLVYPLLNGRDIAEQSRELYAIDAFGLNNEQLLAMSPAIYQHLFDTVYPERQTNRDLRLRRLWWLHRRSNEQVRAAILGLSRFIATSETATHRIFVFLPAAVRPEHKLVVIGSDDAYTLGVLSSRVHVTWAIAAGGRLGVGNDPVYSKTLCFDPFPFPIDNDLHKSQIRNTAERLDTHRKRQQELHPWLTLTGLYNVLELLSSGATFTEEDRSIYEAGLVGILRLLHDELDAAVFGAYGWSSSLTTEQILEKIVTLNAQRRAEEADGLVRWLRPEFQAPDAVPMQAALGGLLPTEPAATTLRKQPWPATLTDQVRAIKDSLRAHPLQTPRQIASGFKASSSTRVAEILDTLTTLGQARLVTEDRYTL